MTDLVAYTGLFFAAFFAATIIPAQSEAILTVLLLDGRYSVLLLITVATVGNVAGSVVNYGLGRGIDRFHHRSWFPLTPERRDRAQHWYRRYGRWSLLLSWAPVIGDPLTLAAGAMREKFVIFLLLVTIAKGGRYLLLLWFLKRMHE